MAFMVVATGPLASADDVATTLDVATLHAEVVAANPLAVAARLATEESEGRLKTARAARMPTIAFESQSSWLANPSDAIELSEGELGVIPGAPPVLLPSGDVIIQDAQDPLYFSRALSLTQPVWTWGKLSAAVELGEREVSLSRTDATRVEASALADLYKDLYALAYQREALSIVREQETLSRRMIESVAASRDAGVVTDLDYREAEIDAEQIRRNAERLEDSVALLERNVLTAAGHTVRDGLRVSTDALAFLPLVEPATLDAWTLRARVENLDAAAAEAASALAASAARLASMRAKGRPDAMLSLKGGWNGSRFPFQDEWDDKSDWFASATLVFRNTILDSGARDGEEASAAAAATKAAANYRNAVSEVDAAIESLYASMGTLEGDMLYYVRRAELKSARAAEKVAAREAGSGSDLTVLEAQVEHSTAVLDLASSRMRYSDTCISLLLLAAPSRLVSGSPFRVAADR